MKRSILIVDDDPEDFEIAAECLRQAGWCYDIDFVADPTEVTCFLQTRNESNALPVLIILDMNMPRISGLELLRKINVLLNKEIPILLYTTHCTDEMVTEVKRFGGHGCIQKGVKYADVLNFARLVLTLIEEKQLNTSKK